MQKLLENERPEITVNGDTLQLINIQDLERIEKLQVLLQYKPSKTKRMLFTKKPDNQINTELIVNN